MSLFLSFDIVKLEQISNQKCLAGEQQCYLFIFSMLVVHSI